MRDYSVIDINIFKAALIIYIFSEIR